MCWDPNPDNRPSASEVDEVFAYSSLGIFEEFNKQIKEADEYRKTNFLSIENSQSIHPQAYYTSRLLNPFTKDLSNDYTDCLDLITIFY
uniref:Serine-threonine/tyrosine-protein kinase catalytic domain-containing protein n=1 Tax=Rhizophagus irregularis (strain DAOM 181602 / DAOM 197198 / MUCL 43194) TaxID=747089 RepID=U9UPC4_RHIID